MREFLRYDSRDCGVGNQRKVIALLLEAADGKDRALGAPGFLIRCRRGGQELVPVSEVFSAVVNRSEGM
jgi:hypothetical protein